MQSCISWGNLGTGLLFAWGGWSEHTAVLPGWIFINLLPLSSIRKGMRQPLKTGDYLRTEGMFSLAIALRPFSIYAAEVGIAVPQTWGF